MPPPDPSQAVGRYEEPSPANATRARRRANRARRRLSEWLQEMQWLLPAGGAIVGIALALLLSKIGDRPDPAMWSVTVDQARNTLMGWLSLVFAGFSIVLAVASLTIQNVVGRFSLRMLRIYERDLRDRIVIAVFAMAATYILTEQTLLRSLAGDELAPTAGVGMSILLLVLSGVVMIWYMTTITRWFRVDKTAQRVAGRSLAAARHAASTGDGVHPAKAGRLDRPEGSTVVPAYRSGYVVDVDVDELLDLAERQNIDIVIVSRTGLPVGRSEAIGWISGDGADVAAANRVALKIDISNTRMLGGSIGYGIVVLVDMAIMALSPSVNDPNTAVEVIEELSFMLPELAAIQLGSYALVDDAGSQRVVVHASTFGDYVKIATEQIVLYGSEEPFVVRALQRLAQVLCDLDLTGHDRQVVDDFRAQVDSPTANA